jgi:hypothetical protein
VSRFGRKATVGRSGRTRSEAYESSSSVGVASEAGIADDCGMYAATGRERLVGIRPPLPAADAGAPSPTAAMVEGTVALCYDDIAGNRVVLRFLGVNSVLLGAPNDEALEGHALYEHGLTYYEFVEVENSSWIAALERANRVHPHHSAETFAGLRHFILPFHDSTFECVAREVDVVPADSDDLLAAAARMIDPHGPQ